VSSAGTKSIALVWFKHDMRIDDHPGLHHALAVGEHVVPFFCFDPVRYRQALESPSAASSLAKAVESLRTALRTLGSDLVVTVGAWEEQLPSAVRRFNAAVVVAEEEVEEVWGHGMAAANAALPDDVEVYTWNAPLFDRGASNENINSNNTTSLDTFADWRRLHDGAAAVMTPLDPPAFLPSLPADIPLEDAGTLPPAEELYKMGQTVLAKSAMGSIGSSLMRRKTSGASTSWHTAQPSSSGFDSDGDTTGMTSTQQPSAALGMRSGAAASKTAAEDAADLEIERLPADEPPSYNAATAEEHADGTAWDAELSAELAAGEGPVMQALQSYLSYVETTGESGGSRWQWKLGAAIAKYDVPAAPDGCFPALFSRALGLGVVSKRRIYAEAQVMLHAEPEWAPPAGILQRLGWLLFSSGGATARLKRTRKAAAASAAIEASEFHASMARRREGKEMHGGATLRHWRWRGILTDYLEGTPKEPLPGAPALVLVHGFGAFSEHWRSNVAALAAQGYHVYAPTLPGYGRSEKPAVRYGQDLWRDYIADFAYQMVGRPVVLAGNSIGGFISASVAADYPDIVAGLVLVNSAGPLQADYVLPSSTPPLPSPPLFVVEAVSRALFAFLQGNVEKQLKRVYPVVPDRADAWLGGEISRASSDPGALGVFRSVYVLC
jgi:pimeloyl-ACP methyl ester carboxylesterase